MPKVVNTKRLTISFPASLESELSEILSELKINRSEFFKRVFDNYLINYRKQKLANIAELMKDEYNNTDLTDLISLDGEDFQ